MYERCVHKRFKNLQSSICWFSHNQLYWSFYIRIHILYTLQYVLFAFNSLVPKVGAGSLLRCVVVWGSN